MNDASYLHIDDGFLHWNHLLHYSVGQDGCIGSMRMHGEMWRSAGLMHIPKMGTRGLADVGEKGRKEGEAIAGIVIDKGKVLFAAD
jgi:hypothetical protein